MRALTRRSASAAIAGALILTGAAACGSSSKSGGDKSSTSNKTKEKAKSDPQATFTSAVTKLGSTKSGLVTIKFAGTEDQILAYGKAASKDESFDANDTKLAHYLATSTVTVASKDGNTAFNVNIDGKPVFQIVGTKASDFYLRAEVKQLAALGGDSASASVNQIAGQLPPQFSFVNDAIAGKWLEIDGAALKQIEQLAASQASAGAIPSVAPGDVKAFQAKLAAVLGADFTAKDAGSDPKGEHLVLTGNVKKLSADIVTALQSIPGASAALTKVDQSDVPDKDVTIDAFVGDDGLSALQLNLAQFADNAQAQATPFPLEVDFSSDAGDVSAPTGATKVDISSLLAGLGGLSGLGKG